MNMEKPANRAANDNERSRSERLQSIRASIEAQGGVKSPLLDRLYTSLNNALNWMASHRALLQEDLAMSLDKIGTIIGRVPDVLYEKYRDAKREGGSWYFTKPVDAIVETYFGARKLTRWGSAFVIRRVQEIKSLSEQSNNVYTTVVEGFRRGAELSKAHRVQREGITEAMIQQYERDQMSKAAFMGTLSDDLDRYLATADDRRTIAQKSGAAARAMQEIFPGQRDLGELEKQAA